jgi:hypothetical protein
MKEIILRMFLTGDATADELGADVRTQMLPSDSPEFVVEKMAIDFELTTTHLVKLCDVTMHGQLDSLYLEPIGFALACSAHFSWNGDTEDGARVAEVVDNWASPETNYRLNATTAGKWRHYLLTGENTFTEADYSR